LFAYVDWSIHLLMSLSKQQQLQRKTVRKPWRWTLLQLQAAGVAENMRVELPPQDKRFSDPAWEQWPFNVLPHGFLLTQHW
jgi:polyhydroxyalkanoate synthase